MKTIVDIKRELGMESLGLFRGETKDNQPTPWYENWDNNTRVKILIHEDLLKVVKAGNATNLGISTAIKTGPQGEYTAKTIVQYSKAPEVVL